MISFCLFNNGRIYREYLKMSQNAQRHMLQIWEYFHLCKGLGKSPPCKDEPVPLSWPLHIPAVRVKSVWRQLSRVCAHTLEREANNSDSRDWRICSYHMKLKVEFPIFSFQILISCSETLLKSLTYMTCIPVMLHNEGIGAEITKQFLQFIQP